MRDVTYLYNTKWERHVFLLRHGDCTIEEGSLVLLVQVLEIARVVVRVVAQVTLA